MLFGAAILLSAIGCRRDSSGSDAGSGLVPTLALGQAQVIGNLHSFGGSLGTWDAVLDDCQPGEYKGFFGVDFYPKGTTHMRLRYVRDEAAGDVMKVAYPQELDKALVLDGETKCTVREGDLQKTTDRTHVPGRGDVAHLKGHLKLDCPTDNGRGRVSGEATFAHCH